MDTLETDKNRSAVDEVPQNKKLTAGIRRFGESRNWNRAVNLFQSAGVKDRILFTEIIRAAVQCRRHDMGLSLFDQMQLENLDPTPSTYLLVMKLHEGLGSCDEVWKYFNKLLAIEKPPLPNVFVPLMSCYATKGDIAAVDKVFAEMVTHSVQPNRAHYGCKVKCFRSMNKPKEAVDTLVTMRSAGFNPTDIEYNQAQGALRSSGIPSNSLHATCHAVDAFFACLKQDDVKRDSFFLEALVGSLLGTTSAKRLASTNGSGEHATAVMRALDIAKKEGFVITDSVQQLSAALQR